MYKINYPFKVIFKNRKIELYVSSGARQYVEDMVQDLVVINIWIDFKDSRISNSRKLYK